MKRSEENKARRLALRKIERSLLEQHTIHLDFNALGEDGVSVRVVPALKPRFFQLYPDAHLGKLRSTYIANEFPENPTDPNDDNENVLFTYLLTALEAFESRDSGKYTIAYDESLPMMTNNSHYEIAQNLLLWEVPMDDTRIHDWWAKCLYTYEDPGISHIKFYVASAIIGDERLPRGEILCLLRLFRGRLRNKGMSNHVIAPVLMISLMRPQHARIIEGYFDGKELVISKSPLYDFTREENAPLRLFARSLFSRPIGDTTKSTVTA